jgi:hypothetical protein
MSNKTSFAYTTEQRHLHNCNLRINGLTVSVKMGKPYQVELDRHLAIREDILTRISETDLATMQAHENRVLTPAEKAAEAKVLAERMSENRDSPSI